MKKIIIGIAALILLSGCGKSTSPAVQLTQPTAPIQTCTVTTAAQGATITCPDGTSSFISNGATGADGLNGINGTNGTNGTNGVAGTQITVVQFCASTFVPTYPSVFPEIGLCINDSLVGVYSANGGFLAPLPPGSYSSNGINASCNFTIGADCQVTD